MPSEFLQSGFVRQVKYLPSKCVCQLRGQPESGHMATTVLLLVHNVELDTILRLPLHVLEEALVDEHLEGTQHAGGKNQDEVTLCGCKTAATATSGH